MRAALPTLAAAAALLFAARASAHVPELQTARVTLRDGHVELALQVDVLALLVALGEPTLGAGPLAESDADLDERLRRAERALGAGARLSADGAEVPLSVRQFPRAAEVRTAAAKAAAGSPGHGVSLVRLETTVPVLQVASLSVALPEQLGPVLYTFEQPETRLVGPGALAPFTVLAAPATPPGDEPEATYRMGLALGACALATVALLSALRRRERSAGHTGPVSEVR